MKISFRMKRRFFPSLKSLLLFVPVFLSFPTLSQTADVPLQVLQKGPSGEVDSANAAQEITATFSQPMVNLTDNESMGNFCPVKIEPEVKGRCRWRGTNTLIFEPADALPPGKHYEVTIPKGTKSQVSGAELSQDYHWGFNTLRLQVQESRPSEGEKWIDLNPLLFVRFNLGVDPEKAAEFVQLFETKIDGGEGGSAVAVTIRRPTAEELKKAHIEYWSMINTLSHKGAVKAERQDSEKILLIQATQSLDSDHAYRLVLKKGFPCAGGDVGLPDDRVIHFETWYKFRLVDHAESSKCIEEQALSFSLSNPVDAKELFDNLVIEPALPVDVETFRYGKRDSSARKVTYMIGNRILQPNTEYKFTLKGGMKDIFGNRLGWLSDSFKIKTGDHCSSLKMTQGFGIMESYLKHRLPVSAMNITDIPIKMAAVPEDQVIPLVKALHWTWYGYYDEYEGEGDAGEVGQADEDESGIQGGRLFKKTKAPPVEDILSFKINRPWSPPGVKNQKLRSFLDLDEVLGSDGGGIVYSQMDYKNQTYRALDTVTPLGITLKTSPDSSLAFITYLKSGHPAANVSLEVRGNDNKVLWKGLTDKSGFADFPGWRGLGMKEWGRSDRPSLWLFAHHKDGTAVLSSAMRGGIDPWRFNINWDDNPPSKTYKGMIFTERGVYRPGEKVHFKGIIRRIDKTDWAFPGLKTIHVKITDPSGSEALKTTCLVSTAGTFNIDFSIPAEGRTGDWNLLASSSETKKRNDYEGFLLNEGFRVEAYKAAAFEVKVKPEKDSYFEGEAYQSRIEGWYLFGAPMAGASYETHLNFEPTSYQPPGWEEYDFIPGWWEQRKYGGKEASSAQGKLDDKGMAQVGAKLDGSDFKGPFRAQLEASVVSPDRQKLFARSSVTVHKSNLYIGIKASTTFIEKGKEWKASVVGVTPDGKPVAGARLTMHIKRRQWHSAEKAGFGGRLQWFSEPKDSVEKDVIITTKDEPVDFTYSPEGTGEYFMTLSGADEKGRPADSSVYVYVAGKGESWWARQDNDIIELVPDKKEYKPGDTARIMVKSPYDASQAMVSVERETVLGHWTTQLAGGADFITVPITDKSLPNIYVSVMLVKGRAAKPEYSEEGLDLAKPQAKFGYVCLKVNPGGRRMSVKVKTDKEDYRPGQKVKVDLWTSDEAGKAIPAEVAFFVVDEGVLSLTGFQTPDPFEIFYGPRPLQILTTDSRLWVVGQRSFGEKGKEHGGGGGRGMLEGIDLRSNFVATAYYNPNVKTGKDGRAAVTFTLPDNLTRFRVMAVALDEKRFGNGEARLVVNKRLVLRPSLPRFSRLGDAFSAGVVAHNDGKNPMDITLDARISGQAIKLDAKESLLRHLKLKPGEAKEVLFQCEAEKLGKAAFQFRAAAGSETDGLEWPIPVEAPEHLETVATSGATPKEAVEQLTLPQGAEKDLGGVRWTFSSSALSGLQDGAAFLLQYPYGCLEQRMSTCLPIITGADLLETFGLGKTEELKKGVQKAMDRVPEFQTAGGGFRYWVDLSGEGPDPWLTCFALEVIHLAKDEGYKVPEDSVAKARQWLGEYLASKKRWAYPYSDSEDYCSRAYAVYVLALWGDKPDSYFSNLYERRDQLPFTGKAYLLKAAHRLLTDPVPAETLAQELLNQAKVSPQSLHFEDPRENGYWMWWIHDSSVRATALCLQALLDVQGGFPNDEKAVKWLVGERKNKGWWRTTQENASVLWALEDYYRHYEKKAPDFTAKLEKEGESQPLWTETFKGRDLHTLIKNLTLDTVFSEGATSRFHASKEGEGRLYYGVSMKYFQPALYRKEAFEGLEVEKTIKPMEGSLDQLKAGTRAVVTLKIRTKQDRTFVAVTDPLPGGFEIVDPSFANEGKAQAKQLTSSDNSWGWYWGEFMRSEKYDDRLQIFADYLTAGEHTYSYLIQATTPGKFTIPSTWAEGMYEPEVFGRTATGAVTIQK